ncbi:MAG: glycosyltransferase family 87 protein [Gaiellaceae bacterium]
MEMDGRSTTHDQRDPLTKALTHGLAFWAIVAPLWVLVTAALGGRFALDFHFAYLPAAHAVLHGASPFHPNSIGAREPFVYPPLFAYLLAPFTLLPPVAAEILATALVAAAVPATLLVLGVRDWRCYAIVFLWWPTIIAIQSANITLPLVFGTALVWRYRDRRATAAVIAGLVIALKPFFWPIIFWFVATRRYRAAAIAAASSAVLVFVPWAGIGFAGLRGYPHLLSHVSSIEGPRLYSVAALLHPMLSWTSATAVEMVFGAAFLIVVLAAGRRGRERDAFALSLVAMLVLSPLFEMHYLVLLLLVVALYRQTFGLAWAVPLLAWGAPANVSGSPAQVAHVLLVVAATVAVAYWDWHPQTPVRTLRSRGRKPADPAPVSY